MCDCGSRCTKGEYKLVLGMKYTHKLTRRDFLVGSGIATLTFLQACMSTTKQISGVLDQTVPIKYSTAGSDAVRFFASSGYVQDVNRINVAVARLQKAGFIVNNQESAYRRYSRFSGTDIQRSADLQDIIFGKTHVPKLLLGVRGGYGAMRILPLVNWARLGDIMREHGTMLVGFSDVTAIQLALMAHGHTISFSGPMIDSDFGSPHLSSYTIHNFIACISNPSVTVMVNQSFAKNSIEGVFWGGNLSILSALVGSTYIPTIEGGILFIEDTGEQPYRLERMLQTLYLSGILARQKAIVLGCFEMDNSIVDQYDNNYNLASVVQTMRRLLKIPIFTDFPFGHIADKVTMPLGATAKISPRNDGYAATFSQYPYLKDAKFNLSALFDTEYQNPLIPHTGDIEPE